MTARFDPPLENKPRRAVVTVTGRAPIEYHAVEAANYAERVGYRISWSTKRVRYWMGIATRIRKPAPKPAARTPQR